MAFDSESPPFFMIMSRTRNGDTQRWPEPLSAWPTACSTCFLASRLPSYVAGGSMAMLETG
jgi:hypothetical protein